jgi:hypothetical protein
MLLRIGLSILNSFTNLGSLLVGGFLTQDSNDLFVTQNGADFFVTQDQ